MNKDMRDNFGVVQYGISQSDIDGIQKETAEQILTDLIILIDNNEDFGRGVFGWKTEEIKMLLKLHIEKKYGVKLNNET